MSSSDSLGAPTPFPPATPAPEDDGFRNWDDEDAPTRRESTPTEALFDEALSIDLGSAEFKAATDYKSTESKSQLPEYEKTIIPGLTEERRYKITGEFARGGMGRILLAYDRATGREVAIKELIGSAHRYDPTPKGGKQGVTDPTIEVSPSMMNDGPMAMPSMSPKPDEITVERFLREARITSRLEHPNIVPVYEISQRKDQTWYYTMKFVRGKTLAKVLRDITRNHQLDESTKQAERLKLLGSFIDICQALAYAHSKGIIHRDLKPDNIMLGQFGETLVLDWGLARVEGEDLKAATAVLSTKALRRKARQVPNATDTPSRSSSRLTMDGSVLGTPAYMPPEQARGNLEEVDHTSDIYSLGAMLYELLSGKRSYEGDDAFEILDALLSGPPKPVTEVAPNLPPELVSVVEKAMARKQGDRYQDAIELANDLRAWRDGRAISTYHYSTREQMARIYKRHKPVVLTTILALLLLLVGGGVALTLIADERNEAEAARDTAQAARDTAQDREKEAELARTQTQAALDEVRRLEEETRNRFANLRQKRMIEYNRQDALASATAPLAPAVEAARAQLESAIAAGSKRASRELREANEKAMNRLSQVIGVHEQLLELATRPIEGTSPQILADSPEEDARLIAAAKDELNEAKLVTVELCTANGDWALARYMLDGARSSGLSDELMGQSMQEISQAEGALMLERRARIEAGLEDVRLGLGRKDRENQDIKLEDYIFEFVAYRDEQTAQMMIDALMAVTKRVLMDSPNAELVLDLNSSLEHKDFPPIPTSHVTLEEQDSVVLAARVLGRLGGHEQGQVALRRTIMAMNDRELIIELFEALTKFNNPDDWFFAGYMEARFSQGISRAIWRTVRSLPMPELAADASAEVCMHHSVFYKKKGDVQRSLECAELAVERLTSDEKVDEYRAQCGYMLSALDRKEEAEAIYIEIKDRLSGTNKAQVYGALALIRAAEDRFDEALVFANEAVAAAAGTKFVAELVRRGRIYAAMEEEKWSLAIADFQDAIHQDPTLEDAYIEMGMVHLRANRDEEAKAAFSYALSINPRSIEARGNRLKARLRTGDTQAAMDDALALIADNPENAQAYSLRGNIYNAMGDMERRNRDYEMAARLDPSPTAIMHRALARWNVNDLAGAESDFKAAAEAAKTPSDRELILYNYANFVSRTSRRNRGLEILDGMLAENILSKEAFLLKSRIHTARREPRLALDTLTTGIERFQAAGWKPLDYINCCFERGLIYGDMKDYAAALQEFEFCKGQVPTSWVVWHRCGMCQRQLGNRNEAFTNLNRALELNRFSSATMRELSLVYSAMDNKPQDALLMLRRAIKTEPKDSDSYVELAKLYETLDQHRDGIAALTEYLTSYPPIAYVVHRRGWLNFKIQNYRAAHTDFVTARTLNPGIIQSWAYSAVCSRSLDEYERAEEEATQAIELSRLPDGTMQEDKNFDWGQAALMRRDVRLSVGNYDGALEDVALIRTTDTEDKDYMFRWMRIEVLMEAARFEQAITEIQEILDAGVVKPARLFQNQLSYSEQQFRDLLATCNEALRIRTLVDQAATTPKEHLEKARAILFWVRDVSITERVERAEAEVLAATNGFETNPDAAALMPLLNIVLEDFHKHTFKRNMRDSQIRIRIADLILKFVDEPMGGKAWLHPKFIAYSAFKETIRHRAAVSDATPFDKAAPEEEKTARSKMLQKLQYRAYDYLDLAIDKGYTNYENLLNDPELDEFRNGPLFRDVFNRMKAAAEKAENAASEKK